MKTQVIIDLSAEDTKKMDALKRKKYTALVIFRCGLDRLTDRHKLSSENADEVL